MTIRVVVGGFPSLAHALESTGQFAAVYPLNSTSDLRELIGQGILKGSPHDIVFLFADTLENNTPNTPLPLLVQKLTTTGFKVMMLALSPAAREIVAANPSAGLLEGPFTLNNALGGIAGLGLHGVQPVQQGFSEIAVPGAPQANTGGGWNAPAAPPANTGGGWNAPAAPPVSADAGWNGTPAAPAPPPAPAPQGEQNPARTLRPMTPPAPPAPPAQASPANGGWQSPAAPPAPSGWGAPQPNPSMPLSASPAPVPGQWGGAGDAQGPVTRPGYTNSVTAPRRGWVITVTSPKGGVGKSSLSLNLAAFLGLRMQAEGKNVCIVDANFQQADTGKYLNVYNPNITNLVRDPSGISRDRIGNYLVHRPDLGISALLGPATPMDANPVYINSKLYLQVLEPLRELYDYIIIDTPVAEKYHDILSSFALPQADFVVVPVTPNWAALMNADSWLNAVCSPRHAGGDGLDERKVGIVLNRAKSTVDCSEEEVRQELSRWNFIGVVPENDSWQRADNNGELIAAQRYTDINDAFSRILYAATRERALLGEVYVAQEAETTKGGLAKVRSLLKRGKK